MIKSAFFTITGMVLSIGLCIAPSKPPMQIKAEGQRQLEDNPSKLMKPSVALSSQTTLTPAEQARFLLRKVYLTGKVGSELPSLDPELEKRVGQKCLITRDQLRSYLERNHITDWEVGGNIDLQGQIAPVKQGFHNLPGVRVKSWQNGRTVAQLLQVERFPAGIDAVIERDVLHGQAGVHAGYAALQPLFADKVA